ncbi:MULTISPECIES: LysR family transcriptional regulator [unclassified Pseudodesulfovibrio]|uniref:LysR family transcriptional regulator n=1 Tax=unclassified Pseudodesulfovibrio TaxID=2661612 RepID=UPI000FEB6A17|nr:MULTISPECIES: LysR family transcriptional regulator [unclassified Pseudodesulfovibrio]MCJ2163419.1 LysR family transcriptional regulator [Pseudodesulfovibrio sp. S3-i]RWU06656.1 LysR family transcriptional regulator [Pseudodesulfovibrio sp. S3]
MQIEQLRRVDLNLLVYFSALAEELHISRAADRLSLSQPAMSRALQRLRDLFNDELMVRMGKEYELTPVGYRLYNELSEMLPKIDRLIDGDKFDPMVESAHFRILLTDNAAAVLTPHLCQKILPAAEKATFHFQAWNEQGYDDLLHGRVDLVLNAADGHIPPVCHTEVIYEDHFVCVVAADSTYEKRISLRDYMAANHIGVNVFNGIQTIPQHRLMQIGAERHCSIHVPYFMTAIRSVARTDLIATVPEKMVEHERLNTAIRIIEPPKEISGFKYLMIWHPRMEQDSGHRWLRDSFRRIGKCVMR